MKLFFAHLLEACAFAALLATSACGGGVSCSDAGSSLTWANFGQRFMVSYCVACHGGGRVEKGVDLTTPGGVAAHAGAVVGQAGTGTAMPPFGSPAPTASERQQLSEWAGCGAR